MANGEESKVRGRVVYAMALLRKDAAGLSREIGRGKDYLRDFIAGRKTDIGAGELLLIEDLISGAEASNVELEKSRELPSVPLVGYVGAGAVYVPFQPGGPIDYVRAPEEATDETVAVEIRGDSLGTLFDRWLVYYDEVRHPPTGNLLNKLCVIGLADDRIVVKKLQRGQIHGLFNLISNTEPPIYDAVVVWAARVLNMCPR